ncbi:TraL conjugative transposon family protein [Bacteroides reticulotermitis]|uniref:TraL conjugative transposon family protein n=1 Tax=Bacteroides reticulotermitis TaxID=1133319 RepID=UPI003A8AF98B
MIRRHFKRMQEWVDERLHILCGRITPEKRLFVLLGMFAIFGVMSIYIFLSAIYSIGKNEGRQIEIEHIEVLELQKRDSINQLKMYKNAREQE